MADPLTNMQFTLGLFQPAVQTFRRYSDAQVGIAERDAALRREDALRAWKRSQDLQDQAAEFNFKRNLANDQMENQRKIASEQTDRALKVANETEARQVANDLRRLYGKYTALNPDKARPLAEFGANDAEQYANLQQAVGKLEQDAIISDSESQLYQKYIGLAGAGAKKLGELGKTPRERAENLIGLIGSEGEARDADAAKSIRNVLGNIDAKITARLTPSPDDMAQAHGSALDALSKDERKQYNIAFNALKSPDAALGRVFLSSPSAGDKYRAALAKSLSTLQLDKTMQDKDLIALENQKKSIQDNLAQMRNPRMAMAALGIDDGSQPAGSPIAATPPPRRPTAADVKALFGTPTPQAAPQLMAPPPQSLLPIPPPQLRYNLQPADPLMYIRSQAPSNTGLQNYNWTLGNGAR